MERVQSLTVRASGGAGRSEGGGWRMICRVVAAGVCAAAAFAGVGCVTATKMSTGFKEAVGLAPPKPATQLTAAFQPQIQFLPDPTQDTQMGAGLVGQMFLFAADGKFTEVDGDLTVFAEDVTPRPAGMPKAVSQMWHFDKTALRKLKTKDERFGDTYALFLPYPPNWKDVTQISVACRYEPKPEVKGQPAPVLSNNPQLMVLDFSTPGKPLWTDVTKGGNKPTAPGTMTAIPDLNKAMVQGRTGATINSQPGVLNTANQNAAATTPMLPPTTHFDATKTHQVVPGANGAQIATTAFALPPGQTLPPGWTINQNRELVPPQGTNPWTVTPPTPGTLAAPNAPTVNAPPIPINPPVGLPNVPNVVAPAAPNLLPTTSTLPPVLPPSVSAAPMPTVPVAPTAPVGFDPNSPVGPWANGANTPNVANMPLPPLPAMNTAPTGGSNTVTIPRR